MRKGSSSSKASIRGKSSCSMKTRWITDLDSKAGCAKLAEFLRPWMWHHHTFNRSTQRSGIRGTRAISVISAAKKANVSDLREASRSLSCAVQRAGQSSHTGSPFHFSLRYCPQDPQNDTELFPMQVTAAGARGGCVMANESCVLGDTLFSDGNLRTFARLLQYLSLSHSGV